tara:strand:- start:366 stop:1019 length:654 start_codon:yes stop_codon:yes gene_type:complete
MAQQNIVIGAANQGNGDTLFDAFTKVQANFDELYIDDTGDVNSVTAGTGISVNQTTGAVVVTNSDPDQTVSLTDGGDIAVSGTYPSFTLTNSAPNYNHTGDVTGATALTIADDVITYAKLGAEYTEASTNGAATGAINLDFDTATVFNLTLSGATTLTFSNEKIGMVKDLVVVPAGSGLTLPSGSTVAGLYSTSATNLIQVVVTGANTYWFSISQAI